MAPWRQVTVNTDWRRARSFVWLTVAPRHQQFRAGLAAESDRSGGGYQTEKYFACGLSTTIALVDCSGCS